MTFWRMSTLVTVFAMPVLLAAESRPAPTRQAPEEALYEITVMGRSDPFRAFLKATARYAALFNQLNDDERFEMTCGDPRTYSLGDGSFCSSQYTATLDGLGAVGDGAHATHEMVSIDGMVERAALLAELLMLPVEPCA